MLHLVDGGDQKELEGAVGNAPAYSADWLSSDEDAEKCPICLNSFCDQPVATPENCAHYFCLDCIEEWARVSAAVIDLNYAYHHSWSRLYGDSS